MYIAWLQLEALKFGIKFVAELESEYCRCYNTRDKPIGSTIGVSSFQLCVVSRWMHELQVNPMLMPRYVMLTGLRSAARLQEFSTYPSEMVGATAAKNQPKFRSAWHLKWSILSGKGRDLSSHSRLLDSWPWLNTTWLVCHVWACDYLNRWRGCFRHNNDRFRL